jgi:hypothetical protein
MSLPPPQYYFLNSKGKLIFITQRSIVIALEKQVEPTDARCVADVNCALSRVPDGHLIIYSFKKIYLRTGEVAQVVEC